MTRRHLEINIASLALSLADGASVDALNFDSRAASVAAIIGVRELRPPS
jgi:hypothetical protein